MQFLMIELIVYVTLIDYGMASFDKLNGTTSIKTYPPESPYHPRGHSAFMLAFLAVQMLTLIPAIQNNISQEIEILTIIENYSFSEELLQFKKD